MSKKIDKKFHYCGALHIHTTESDGTKTIEEVVELGQQCGLDFMLFTDHMTLSDQENGKERFYDKTLVLVGYEHNDLNDKHHYLFFDTHKVYPETMSASEYVSAGANDYGVGIIAHPDEIRDSLEDYPPYPWEDWSVKGYTGLELWNQMSEWMEKLTKYNKLFMLFSPRKSIVAPTDRILKKWDSLNLVQKVVGVAGVDAHAFPYRVGPLTVEIFPYKVHFKTLRTYLILDQPFSEELDIARQQLFQALRNCNVYFANVRCGDAINFNFNIYNNEGIACCGESILFTDNTMLKVKLPAKATIKIIHNGNKIAEAKSDIIECKVYEKGIYRIEAWKKKHGWIFSNHIRVGV